MASKAGSQSKLHTAKKAEDVVKYLNDKEDPDGLDDNGDAPIHAYVQRQDKHRFECLMALLIHSKCDVDFENHDGNTALHLAAELDDVLMAKALLSFRADVNCLNRMNETPLNIAHRKNYESDLVLVLSGVGGQFHDAVMRDLYQLPALRLWGDADGAKVVREDKPADKQCKKFISAEDSSQQPSTENSTTNGYGAHQHKVRFTTPDASVECGLTAQEVSSVKTRGLYVETPDTSLTESWVNVKLSTPPVSPTSDSSGSLELSSAPTHSEAAKSDFVDSGSLYTKLVHNTQSAMNKGLEASTLMGDEGYAAWLQYRELKRNMKRAGLSTTSIGAKKSASLYGGLALKDEPLIFRAKGGERVLCLDGGGVKGLVQIEILSQVESASGRRIIELFDWIVGTSTGGILALALVYAGLSLDDLRRLYFELKSEVFKNPKLGYGCDTLALERIMKRTFGEGVMMDRVTPKVMIAAVDKSTTALNLIFFNNCFNNKYSTAPVWKVARYTSAAPIYFSECDNYVDGGVLANNPCDYALTDIQNFLDASDSTSKIACVVSVGCGSYPPRKVDSTDLPLIAVGKKTKLTDFPKRLQNMVTLLLTALTKSEDVARNCQSRCERQGIPFFRFSPELDEPVSAIESNDEKLCDIIVRAQMLLQANNALDELIQHFYYTSAFENES